MTLKEKTKYYTKMFIPTVQASIVPYRTLQRLTLSFVLFDMNIKNKYFRQFEHSANAAMPSQKPSW